MQEIMQSIDWMELINALWAIVILPLLTYIGKQIHEWTKAKKIDKHSDILYKNVTAAVKDVYETTVKDIKGTEDWTPEKQNEVKELAKTKAIQALSNSAYQILKAANNDFSAWLDSLVGTALYDLKNK